MTTATDPRGCPGTWVLHDNWSGHPTYSGNDTYAGYEYDDPTWTLDVGSSVSWSLLCVGTDNRSLASASINDPNSTLFSDSKTFTKTDPNCQSVPPQGVGYDCINGECIVKTQYKTPGLYQSLADCQAVCANGGACGSGRQCVDPTTFCPDGKVCIDQGEFTSIEALISKIGSEVC